MAEKLLYLAGVDPVIIYGVNDVRLELIKSYFPKTKIVARGDLVKVIGDDEQIAFFEQRLNLMVDHYKKFNRLTDQDVETIIIDDLNKLKKSIEGEDSYILYANSGKPIKARSESQKNMVEAFKHSDLLFAIGPAGTGKTYLAIALAVRALRNREIKRIILSRPAVESGEHLGFLPGDMKEKLDPYMQALYDALNDMVPQKKLADYFEDRTIQIAPLAFMRGRTLNNAIVILDEAQNSSIKQIKMFLTRMGENSKFIVTGDITQIDLPNKHQSGLIQSQKILKGLDGIATIEFSSEEIVRHRLVKQIVNAYEKELKDNE